MAVGVMLGVTVVAVAAPLTTMIFTQGASPKNVPFASAIFHVPVDSPVVFGATNGTEI